jgi:hypothetical protein
MFQNLVAGLIMLASSNNLYPDGISVNGAGNHKPDYVVADQRPEDRDRDPGKDITDDPHGPGPHGRNPHGPDPHDEVHDNKLPANDPDSYLGRS